jgi:hypothetical protein
VAVDPRVADAARLADEDVAVAEVDGVHRRITDPGSPGRRRRT